jgi:hypothetical protein
MTLPPKQSNDDQLSDEDAAKRMDNALRRALKTPAKPHQGGKNAASKKLKGLGRDGGGKGTDRATK